MVKINLGVKRHCIRCSNRFYDLGKNPVACPKCKQLNDINAPFRPRRRGKAASKPTLVEREKAAAAAAKKAAPVKQIEGVDVAEFEDIEIAGDEEIEEIEEGDEIETIEEIEEDSEDMDDDIKLEEADVVGAVLVDDVDDPLVVDDDDAGEKAKPIKLTRDKDDQKASSGKGASGKAKTAAKQGKAKAAAKKPAAKKKTKQPVKKARPVKKAAVKKPAKKVRPAPKAKAKVKKRKR